MKFERLLARRYITAQKRHSALTVCSITIAVALITMLFCLFTTWLSVQRNQAYDEFPGHFAFYRLTKEQAYALNDIPEVCKVDFVEGENGWTTTYLTIDRLINDKKDMADKVRKALHLTEQQTKTLDYEPNNNLLMYDRFTDEANLKIAVMFAMFFIFVIIFTLMLRLMIDTAFEVSSKERERQFGVLQSIGATPKQIVRIMTHEGLLLSAIGVPLGGGLGILFGYVTYRAVLATGVARVLFDSDEKIAKLVNYTVSPWMVLIAMGFGLMWIMLSAYGTGMRVIKKPPVAAINARPNAIMKVQRFSISEKLFGWTGKLAARNANRQKKRFIVTVLSLTLSLLMFAAFSTIMDKVEKTYLNNLYPIDEFGYSEAEFGIMYMYEEPNSYDSFNSDSDIPLVSHDPLAYREGIKLLENSGYFKNIEHAFNVSGREGGSGSEGTYYFVNYVNRALYERIMKNSDIAMTYDEFVAYGKGITIDAPDDFKQDTISFTVTVLNPISNEEGEKLYDPENPPKENEEGVIRIGSGKDWDPYHYDRRSISEITLPVGKNIKMSKTPSWFIYTEDSKLIIMPYERFEQDLKMFHDFPNYSSEIITCSLKNSSDYQNAVRFLDENPNLELTDDFYKERQSASKINAAVKTAALFINIMIALIAAVNMINIISTGIINRKSELAAMQCSGMTRGQMYRMTMIEALQFVLWAAILAAVLAGLLLLGTNSMMEMIVDDPVIFQQLGIDTENGSIVSFMVPLLRIVLASAAAFGVALLASLIPLRRMQKEPLVEQIRAIE